MNNEGDAMANEEVVNEVETKRRNNRKRLRELLDEINDKNVAEIKNPESDPAKKLAQRYNELDKIQVAREFIADNQETLASVDNSYYKFFANRLEVSLNQQHATKKEHAERLEDAIKVDGIYKTLAFIQEDQKISWEDDKDEGKYNHEEKYNYDTLPEDSEEEDADEE